MSSKGFGTVSFGLLASLLAGCESSGVIVSTTASAVDTSSVGSLMRLHAGDKLKITVFGEEKLSGEYEIDLDGSVSLPLAGTVKAAGLTRPELEQLLSKKFSNDQFLRNPKVTVDIASFRPFYVLGEVEKPGEYPFKSGLNVVSAVAVAGGNSYRANQSHVLIQRAGENEFREHPFAPNVPVYPGDLIRVQERYF